MPSYHIFSFFFFFNDTATTEIYTLSLHDALPISAVMDQHLRAGLGEGQRAGAANAARGAGDESGLSCKVFHCRSEEHTSELQSRSDLVCRLLLEKKKRTRS